MALGCGKVVTVLNELDKVIDTWTFNLRKE
jgi:hypothetical protein